MIRGAAERPTHPKLANMKSPRASQVMTDISGNPYKPPQSSLGNSESYSLPVFNPTLSAIIDASVFTLIALSFGDKPSSALESLIPDLAVAIGLYFAYRKRNPLPISNFIMITMTVGFVWGIIILPIRMARSAAYYAALHHLPIPPHIRIIRDIGDVVFIFGVAIFFSLGFSVDALLTHFFRRQIIRLLHKLRLKTV